jgi:hypothetical protein
VSAFLALLGVLLTLLINSSLAQQEQARQQRLENYRAQRELELAEQRTQDEVLQTYLGQIGSLLLQKDLSAAKEDSVVRTLARARTLTVLEALDPSRKTAVMQFLVESELVQAVRRPWLGRAHIISLAGADLSGANLSGADLSGANLSGADLSGANLSGADLSDAYLEDAKGITSEGLELQARHLEGATMPNGSKHP